MPTDTPLPPQADFDLVESDFAPISPAVRKPSKLDGLTPGTLLGVALLSTCLTSVLLIVPIVAFGASLWYGYCYLRDVEARVETPPQSPPPASVPPQ